MGNKTNIQWTDTTWNIAVGCTKVDADCKYCYMYRESLNATRYTPTHIRRTTTVFNLPLKYKETKSQCWDGPPLVFTCSLTDFFHPSIDGYRHEAWDIIRKCPHLVFQILTKRPERITEQTPPDILQMHNVWFGTSIGSEKGMTRLTDLLQVKCKTRFLSLEPLHEMIDIPFMGTAPKDWGYGYVPIHSLIHWVIVGGESGNDNGAYRYRPCHTAWIGEIVKECQFFKIPVFVKQLGTHIAKELNLTDRHGGNINEFPVKLQVREFPNHI